MFIVLKKGTDVSQERLSNELKELVSKKIAKYASPEYVQVTARRPVPADTAPCMPSTLSQQHGGSPFPTAPSPR